MERKNVFLAVLLAILFGPLGLLYANVTAAIIYLVLLVGSIAVFGSAALVVSVPIVWILAIFKATVSSSLHNARLARSKASPSGPNAQADSGEPCADADAA